MTTKAKRGVSAEYQKLATAAENAHFECGEWDGDESDETYETVYNRALRAQKKLDAYVRRLERGLRFGVREISDFDDHCKEHEYTDTSDAWETFYAVMFRLQEALTGKKTETDAPEPNRPVTSAHITAEDTELYSGDAAQIQQDRANEDTPRGVR